MQTTVNLIAAIGQNRELGIGTKLLGNFPTDMKHFVSLTQNSVVIMGRKTFDSLRKKPLPNRINIVVSRNPTFSFDGVLVARSCHEALDLAQQVADGRQIFVIGGESIYKQFLEDDLIDQIHLTEIKASFPEADKFFPTSGDGWQRISQRTIEADGVIMRFSIYNKTR